MNLKVILGMECWIMITNIHVCYCPIMLCQVDFVQLCCSIGFINLKREFRPFSFLLEKVLISIFEFCMM